MFMNSSNFLWTVYPSMVHSNKSRELHLHYIWLTWQGKNQTISSNYHKPWNQGQTVIKLRTKHVIYQKLANLCRKKMSMLTDLKVSSLACECAFYRPEQNILQTEDPNMNWILKILKCKNEIYQWIGLKK